MKRTLGFALLFTIAYLLIFSSPLKKEPVFKPAWVQNLAAPTSIPAAKDAVNIGFRIGNIFGYATPQGTIKYLDTTQFNVAMENGKFVNYSSVSKNLVEKDASGRIVLSINSDGYPLFIGGRFFIISTDRTALSEINEQGSTLWSRDFGSLITAMDSNSTTTVVGLLNGSIEVVGKTGKELFHYRPTGSKLPAIYGCAISASGDHIAMVSGLEPQRFTLLTRDPKSEYRPQRVVDLGTDIRRETYLHFFPGIPNVYVEVPNAVEYYSTTGASSGKIPVSGSIASMAAQNGLVYAVSSQSSQAGAELTAFAPSGGVVARQNFANGALFLKAIDKSIYLGTGHRLMRIDFELE